MSVDLSSITEIRDKIGVVTKITDASGMVLWSAVKKATITVTVDDEVGNLPYVEHNGITYESTVTFEANIGDTIYCDAGSTDYSYIEVNGEQVSVYYPYYNYVIVSDATIDIHAYTDYDGGDQYYYTNIYITDANS